jgi:CelD/BcsL family acetyltransferase involved in cellulose biosynthesis
VTGSVVQLDPAADPRWDRFVDACPAASVWHSSAWLEVIRQTYAYRPLHLAFERDGQLEAILPLFLVASRLTGRRLVSVPFSGPAGPVGLEPAPVDALVEAACTYLSALDCDHLLLQRPGDQPALGKSGLFVTRPFVCSRLLLAATSYRRPSRPSKTSRKQIRRARDWGLQVEIRADRELLPAFYLLYLQTSRRHGIPPQPKRLFDAIWQRFAPLDGVRLLVAALGGRPVYAAVCLLHRETFSVVYCGIDYRYLAWHPVRAGDWFAAEWAREHGFTVLDLLQSHVRNTGLRYYKQSLGAVEVPVEHVYFPAPGPTSALRELLIGGRSPLARALTTTVRHLPECLLIALGERAFPHVG